MDDTLHVLFVDDEPRITSALMRVLRSLEPKWKLQAAASGPEALDKLSQSTVDVVVTDMRMPEMSGSDLIREINWRYPWVVKIMLSGIVDPSLVEQAQRWPQRYLFKPCPPERMREEILLAVVMRDGDLTLERKQPLPVTRPRVLLVEDREGEAELLRQSFVDLGDRVELEHVLDGAIALEHLGSTDRAPHAIVLDLRMPRMGGIEFLQRYRERRRCSAPVIVLTMSLDQEERTRAVREGASFCLTKATTLDEWGSLAQRLERYARLTAEVHSSAG
jgi:CheY-like chemotaxis protein